MIELPLAAYRFIVTLDPADAYLPPVQAALLALFPGGAFQEVKGLGADLEPALSRCKRGKNHLSSAECPQTLI